MTIAKYVLQDGEWHAHRKEISNGRKVEGTSGVGV